MCATPTLVSQSEGDYREPVGLPLQGISMYDPCDGDVAGAHHACGVDPLLLPMRDPLAEDDFGQSPRDRVLAPIDISTCNMVGPQTSASKIDLGLRYGSVSSSHGDHIAIDSSDLGEVCSATQDTEDSTFAILLQAAKTSLDEGQGSLKRNEASRLAVVESLPVEGVQARLAPMSGTGTMSQRGHEIPKCDPMGKEVDWSVQDHWARCGSFSTGNEDNVAIGSHSFVSEVCSASRNTENATCVGLLQAGKASPGKKRRRTRASIRASRAAAAVVGGVEAGSMMSATGPAGQRGHEESECDPVGRLHDWPDSCTTVMLRNVPNRYSAEELIAEMLAQGFEDTFDFFYLPIDFKTKRNRGYAFINFRTAKNAADFASIFQGQHLNRYQTQKILEVTPAATQGFEANVTQYVRKDTQRVQNPWFKPMIFLREEEEPRSDDPQIDVFQ